MQVIIIGGGKTGSHLASRLIDDGIQVSVIEQRAEVVARLKAKCPGATVIEGNGADPETLERAGVHVADSVAAVTGLDETNLVVSMLAKMEYSAPRVVARVNNPANAWMFTPANGVDVGVSQAEITARFVIEGMNAHEMYTLMKLGRDGHSIVQATVGEQSMVAGKPLKRITFPDETIVTAIDRDDEITVPNGDTVLKPGDEAIIFTSEDGRDQIRRLFS